MHIYIYIYIYSYIYGIYVVVRTNPSDIESQRQVGVDRVITSVRLGGVIVSRLVQNARDVGSIAGLIGYFPRLSSLSHWCHDQDPTQVTQESYYHRHTQFQI